MRASAKPPSDFEEKLGIVMLLILVIGAPAVVWGAALTTNAISIVNAALFTVVNIGSFLVSIFYMIRSPVLMVWIAGGILGIVEIIFTLQAVFL